MDIGRRRKAAWACVITTVPMSLIALLGVWPLPLFRPAPALEATKDQVEINRYGVVLPRLMITNKGHSLIRIYEVRVNGRDKPDCISKPDQAYDVGDSFGMIIPFTCGDLVRVTVKTDRGELEFEW
jgi:hypothetical protein